LVHYVRQQHRKLYTKFKKCEFELKVSIYFGEHSSTWIDKFCPVFHT
jgi:hypothetical protein